MVNLTFYLLTHFLGTDTSKKFVGHKIKMALKIISGNRQLVFLTR
jgi:hypothetical protein